MTDPKNRDDEPDETPSSGEPDAADTDLESTDVASSEEPVEEVEPDEEVESVEEVESDDDVDDAGDTANDDDDDSDERKEKPVATGKASRSGNPARAAEADDEPRSTTPVKPKKIGNRWAAPAMLASAGIGLLWIVLYYVFSNRENPIPLMSDLGDWNLIVGMAFIVAAFGFSMKWE